MLFDVSDACGTAITQLGRVEVKIRKVLSHKFEEQFTNICFHILAIWWVERYNLCFSFFERFEHCYYSNTLMKNVHYPLVLFHIQI